MTNQRYRVEAVCDKCEESWTTNAKESPKAPYQCKFCGSTKTGKIDFWVLKDTIETQNI